MISLEEFRDSYINEDINAEAVNTETHPTDVFIESAVDILTNDYSLINGMETCYFDFNKGNRAYKNMHVDAAYLDLSANVVNLLFADFNPGEIKNIANEFITNKAQLLLNYFENTLKGFFVNGEQADPPVQMAKDIRSNISNI